MPRQGSLSGRVFTTGQPLRLAHPRDEAGLASVASGALDVGPVLVVPLRGSTRVHGVLSLARLRGRPAFTADDLDMAAGFANQAAVAIELAEARAEQQRAAMLDERERIAADLHDHVIQRLFAAGLSLQSPGRHPRAGPGRHGSWPAIADLDATIARSAPASSSCSRTPRPRRAACGPACWTWSPSDPGARVRPRPCGSPGCSTACPTDSPRTCWPCSARR